MVKKKLLKENIKKYFRNLEIKQRKFIPGKSKITVAFPPYNGDEVWEALDSMLNFQTTMGNKVKKFEKNLQDMLGQNMQSW